MGPQKTTEEVREVIESLGWKMLSSKYLGYNKSIAVECPEGHIQKKTFNSIKKQSKCMKCHYKSGVAGRKTHKYEAVKADIESFKYQLISTEYKRSTDLLDMICNNGHKCKIAYKKFKIDRRCRYCDPSRKKEYSEVKSFVELQGFALLNEKYSPTEKIKIQCSYGHVSERKWGDFYQRPTCIGCSRPHKGVTREECRVIYSKSDKGIYSRYTNDCNRRGRLKRGIRMLLTLEEFSPLINDNCYYCGKENCRGVDRLDSDGSYTLENSKPCCKTCNQMKNDMTEQELIDHIKQIIKHKEIT